MYRTRGGGNAPRSGTAALALTAGPGPAGCQLSGVAEPSPTTPRTGVPGAPRLSQPQGRCTGLRGAVFAAPGAHSPRFPGYPGPVPVPPDTCAPGPGSAAVAGPRPSAARLRPSSSLTNR